MKEPDWDRESKIAIIGCWVLFVLALIITCPWITP
jgi:hypothetical protein